MTICLSCILKNNIKILFKLLRDKKQTPSTQPKLSWVDYCILNGSFFGKLTCTHLLVYPNISSCYIHIPSSISIYNINSYIYGYLNFGWYVFCSYHTLRYILYCSYCPLPLIININFSNTTHFSKRKNVLLNSEFNFGNTL